MAEIQEGDTKEGKDNKRVLTRGYFGERSDGDRHSVRS